jgi:hypothetical protein
MTPDKIKFFSKILSRDNLNSVGVIVAILLGIGNASLSKRGVLLSMTYDIKDVEDYELPGYDRTIKKLKIQATFQNVGDGPVVIRTFLLADSLLNPNFDPDFDLHGMTVHEQAKAIADYNNCRHYIGTGWAERMPNQGFIASDDSISTHSYIDFVEGIVSRPICMKVNLTDQFDYSHNILIRIGTVSGGSSVTDSTGNKHLNVEIELDPFVYVIPWQSCAKIFNDVWCI